MTQYFRNIKLQKSKSLDSLKVIKREQGMKEKISTGPKIQPLFKHRIKAEPKLLTDSRPQSINNIKRVKSTQNFKLPDKNPSYDNILQWYKTENDNLKSHNKFLVHQIRKRKRNQELLYNYIDQLKKQIVKIESRNRVSPRKDKIFTSAPDTSRTNLETFYSSATITEQSSEDTAMVHEMEELSNKFNKLMEQCSRQSNKKARNIMRSKLAETAEKMKSFRKGYGI